MSGLWPILPIQLQRCLEFLERTAIDVIVQFDTRPEYLRFMTSEAKQALVNFVPDMPFNAIIRMKPSAPLCSPPALKRPVTAKQIRKMVRIGFGEEKRMRVERKAMDLNSLLRSELFIE
jgi:hypothetical protein